MADAIVVQSWTEYERGWGSRPAGKTLHLNMEACRKFRDDYLARQHGGRGADFVPDEYDMPEGQPRMVRVAKELYERVQQSAEKGGIWWMEGKLPAPAPAGNIAQAFPLPSVNESELVRALANHGLKDNELIQAALSQAQCSHGYQRRDDGSSYLEQHIYPVTLSVIEHEAVLGRPVSAGIVATALLHDVLEDDPLMDIERFRKLYGVRIGDGSPLLHGETVADFVEPLTKRDPELYPGRTLLERKAARDKHYKKELLKAPYESQLVKLADRDNNLRCVHVCKPEKIARCLSDTESFFIPLAESVSPRYRDSLLRRVRELRQVMERSESDRG